MPDGGEAVSGDKTWFIGMASSRVWQQLRFCFLSLPLLLMLGAESRAEPAWCPQVRAAVGSYGAIVMTAWAKKEGYTGAQIAQARACLRKQQKEATR